MSSFEEMSTAEVEQYAAAFKATTSSLATAVGILNFLADYADTPEDRADASAQALTARRALALAEAQFTAVTRQKGAVTPPSPKIVAHAVELARKLGDIDWKDATVRAAVGIFQEAGNLFSKLHGGTVVQETKAMPKMLLTALSNLHQP